MSSHWSSVASWWGSHKVVVSHKKGRQSVFATQSLGSSKCLYDWSSRLSNVITIGCHGRTKFMKGVTWVKKLYKFVTCHHFWSPKTSTWQSCILQHSDTHSYTTNYSPTILAFTPPSPLCLGPPIICQWSGVAPSCRENYPLICSWNIIEKNLVSTVVAPTRPCWRESCCSIQKPIP